MKRHRQRPNIEIRAPFSEADLPLLWTWLRSYWSQVAADDTPSDLAGFVEHYQARLENSVNFGVYVDGSLAGFLEFDPAGDKLGVCHGFFARQFWGRHITQYAINLGLAYLFLHGVELVLFTPFSRNRAIILLEKSLGAVEVGESKGRFIQNGEPINTTVLALLSDSWAAANPEFIAEQRKIMEEAMTEVEA